MLPIPTTLTIILRDFIFHTHVRQVANSCGPTAQRGWERWRRAEKSADAARGRVPVQRG